MPRLSPFRVGNTEPGVGVAVGNGEQRTGTGQRGVELACKLRREMVGMLLDPFVGDLPGAPVRLHQTSLRGGWGHRGLGCPQGALCPSRASGASGPAAAVPDAASPPRCAAATPSDSSTSAV